MPNVFTDIVDKVFARSLMALRENAVTPRLVNTNWGTEVAQRGDTINVPIPSAVQTSDVAPGATPPAGGDDEVRVVPIALNRWRQTSAHLTDKEAAEVAEGSRDGLITEHLRALANDVDVYLLGLYRGVYGYTGTAGTTPFATDTSDVTEARKILNRQLAPLPDRRFLLDPDAEAAALNLRAFQDGSWRGDQAGIVEGAIGRKFGFDFAMNQNIPTHTSPAFSAGAVTVNGANAAGATSVSIAKATNPHDLLAGDILTFAGHDQTYTVLANTTLAVGNTSVPIAPALQVGLAGGEVVTKAASHVVNMAFHRDAFALAVRPLAPADGFSGGNQIRTGVDPVSGLAITLEVSREHARTKWMWSILYGASLIRPELAVRLAG